MITNYGNPEFRWSVLVWDGVEDDLAALTHLEYVVLDGDLMLFAEDSEANTTRGLLLEHGDKVVVSPLGWLPYKEEIEQLLASVLGE